MSIWTTVQIMAMFIFYEQAWMMNVKG